MTKKCDCTGRPLGTPQCQKCLAESEKTASGPLGAATCSPISVELDGYRVETWSENNKEENAKMQLAGWHALGCPPCSSITKINPENADVDARRDKTPNPSDG